MARGGGAARSMSEYLVSLGVEVDHRGLNRMRNALTMTKVTVMGVGAALALMTTAVVKASLSLTKAAEGYEELAKSSKKATDEIASQEIALKVMGKTLDEINKNDKLKRTFEDIKKVGREIGFPTAGEGRRSLEGLMTEVDRLRATSLYAFQWINHHFLTKLAGPMDAFRKSLEEMRQNIVTNMPNLSARVGGFFAGFIQLIMAGVRGLGDLGKYIAALPDNIKMLLGAFSGLWVVMKANPIFMVLAGLTSLLLLLDDFQTYQAGGKSAWGDVWAGLEDGTFADKAVKGLEEGIDTIKGKVDEFLGVAEDVSGKFVDKIYEYDFAGAGDKAGKFLNNLVTSISGWFANPDSTDTFNNVIKSAGGIATGLLNALASAMGATEWKTVGKDAGSFVTNLFSGIADSLKSIVDGKGEGGGIIDAAWGAIKGLGTGIIEAIAGFFENVEIDQIFNSIKGMIESIFSKMTEVLTDAKADDIGKAFGDAVGNAITKGADLVGKMVNWITEQLKDGSVVANLFNAGADFAREFINGFLESIGDMFVDLWKGLPGYSQRRKASKGITFYKEDGTVMTGTEKEQFTLTADDEQFASALKSGHRSVGSQMLEQISNLVGVDLVDNEGKRVFDRLTAVFGGLLETDEHGAIPQSGETRRYLGGLSDQYAKAENDSARADAALKYVAYARAFNDAEYQGTGSQKDHGKIMEQAVEIEARLKEELDTLIGDPIPAEIDVGKEKISSDVEAGIRAGAKAVGTLTIPAKVDVKGGKQTGAKKATGDRFDSPTHIEVAETGEVEYLIPINRPERAKALILQMLSEMGSGARTILESFGIPRGQSIDGITADINSRMAMVGAYPSGNTTIKSNSDNTNNYTSSPSIVVYANDPHVAGLATAREVDRAMMKYIRGGG